MQVPGAPCFRYVELSFTKSTAKLLKFGTGLEAMSIFLVLRPRKSMDTSENTCLGSERTVREINISNNLYSKELNTDEDQKHLHKRKLPKRR